MAKHAWILGGSALFALLAAWAWLGRAPLGPPAALERGSQSSNSDDLWAQARSAPAPLLARTPASTVTADATSTAAVEGGPGALEVTLRYEDGAPARGMAVLLKSVRRGLPMHSAERRFTNDNGWVRFEELRPGPYLAASPRSGPPRSEIRIVPDETVRVDLRVRPGVHVRGAVVNPDGQPIPSAEVWMTTGSRDWLGGHIVATTDERGQFVLHDAPERQSLGAIAAGYGPSKLVDLELLEVVDSGAQVTLRLGSGGGALTGTVLEPSGAPVENALVAVGSVPSMRGIGAAGNRVEFWTPRTARTDKRGEFDMAGLAVGTHEVVVRVRSDTRWLGECRIQQAETTALTARLTSPCQVSGTVTDTGGHGVAGATLSVLRGTVPKARRNELQTNASGAFGLSVARSDEHGRYVLGPIPSGPVTVVARGTEQSPGQDSIELALGEGQAHRWNPELGENGVIHGRVLHADGRPISMVQVNVRRQELEGSETSSASETRVTDAKGRFRFDGLEERIYCVTADLDLPADAAHGLQLMGVLPAGGEVILRAPAEAAAPPAYGEVRGEVRDSAQRFRGCRRSLLLEDDRHGWRTDAAWDGDTFRFSKVRAGRHRIAVMCGDEPVLFGEWFDVTPDRLANVGVMTTQPPATLGVQLACAKGVDSICSTLVIRPIQASQRKRVAIEEVGEHVLEGLCPGPCEVYLYGKAVANVFQVVDLVPGERLDLDILLEPAAMVPIKVTWLDGDFAELTLTATEIGGQERWSIAMRRDPALTSPYQMGLQLPVGRFRLDAKFDGQQRGHVEFDVASLDTKHAQVVLGLE